MEIWIRTLIYLDTEMKHCISRLTLKAIAGAFKSAYLLFRKGQFLYDKPNNQPWGQNVTLTFKVKMQG